MLILSRTIHNNEIVIGNQPEMTVKVLNISRGQVRIGIEAPACIPIHRREVFDRIQKETDEENKH